MLKEFKFDPMKPLRVVFYLRMSSDSQNPRSPEQQADSIRETYQRLGYPWVEVATYTDAGVSGKFNDKRPAFKQMLGDLRSRRVAADAILVDTFDRFGRNSEIPRIRADLEQYQGVYVLTAESRFADPSTPEGKIVGVVDAVRAEKDNRTKAHQVSRGKRDSVKLKRWPGGDPPFGFRLKSVLVDDKGRKKVAYSELIADPETSVTIRALFEKKKETAWGAINLAKWLNDNPEVPESQKPFAATTVGRWLVDPIYVGEMVYGEESTGVIDDRTIREKNPENEVLRVPDFCEALIDRALWDAVQEQRIRRSRPRAPSTDDPNAVEKQIAPRVGGIPLTYPLSGLMLCATCGRAMTASSGGWYTSRTTGEERRYTDYLCPRSLDGTCDNRVRVPEPWLRKEVLTLVRGRLFPLPEGQTFTAESVAEAPWYADLENSIQKELDRQAASRVDNRPLLEAEQASLCASITGWTLSLGKPDLSAAVRVLLEDQLGKAATRLRAVEQDLAAANQAKAESRLIADPVGATEQLSRLAEVLETGHAARLNLELSRHVEGIRCHPDGRVVVRTCRIGALSGSQFAARETPPPEAPTALHPGTPLRRAMRQLDCDDAGPALRQMAAVAADVNRFAGLGADWFAEDEFTIPEPTFWSKEHAEAVAESRATGMTHEQLADHFGVSTPTIQHALRIATERGLLDPEVPRKMPRARWPELHFHEVAAAYAEGQTVMELTKRFDKSQPLISTALRLAREHAARVKEAAGGGRLSLVPTFNGRGRDPEASGRRFLPGVAGRLHSQETPPTDSCPRSRRGISVVEFIASTRRDGPGTER